MSELELELDDIKPATPELNPVFASRSELDRKAEELRARIALPKKPGSAVPFKDMIEWLKLVPTEALDNLMIYLYRLNPVVNRQQVDPNSANYIDVYSGENIRHLSEELVADTHGGGKYRFMVNDLNKKGKNERGEGFRSDFFIPIVNNPPKLDFKEVVWDDPNNKGYRSWCRSKNLINDQNMPVDITTQGTTAAPNQDAMVNAMKLAMDFAEKMSAKDQAELKRRIGAEDNVGKAIGDIFIEKMKQEDPNKQMATLATMMGAMKGMMPEPQKNSDSAMMPAMMTMVTTLLTTMVEAGNRHSEMMMKFIEMGQKNPGEDRDEFAKLKDLLEIAKEVKGGGTANRSTAEVIMDGATTLLAPALQLVNNIMTMNAMKQGGIPGGAPGVPGMGGSPAPTGPNNQSLGRSTPMNPSNPSQGAPPAIAGPGEAASIIANYAPLIVRHLGHDGWEFGIMVSEMFGDEIAAAIARYGVDNLLNASKATPQLWQQVESTYGEAHFRKWLESLCNYRDEAKKADAEDLEPVDEKGTT